MRGIKTLKARMDMHQQGAAKVAEWLSRQPEIRQVYFPGLPDHPGKDIHDRQAGGPGGIVSFRMKDGPAARQVLEALCLPALAVSLGGVESIISYPVNMSHAGMHPAHRERTGVTDDLVRLSVGLEDPDDLVADLEAAIKKI
jgi:cystathionine beta-lyase